MKDTWELAVAECERLIAWAEARILQTERVIQCHMEF